MKNTFALLILFICSYNNSSAQKVTYESLKGSWYVDSPKDSVLFIFVDTVTLSMVYRGHTMPNSIYKIDTTRQPNVLSMEHTEMGMVKRQQLTMNFIGNDTLELTQLKNHAPGDNSQNSTEVITLILIRKRNSP